MTESNDKLDNMTVRRFAKLIKGNGSNNGSTGITTGTVVQNDNQLYVAVDDETLVPVSDTASNVNVGDKVTLAIDNEEALIVGNNSDASPTASELSETDTKATFAKVDASEAKDTAQTAQVTANTAQNTAETAQTTADNAQSTATEAKETADAVDGKATEAKETATQAQATATTASETATQAKETAEAVDAKATEAQTTATEAQSTANTAQTTANTAKETADTASTKADNAQSTADTASTKADNAQTTADTASSKADTAQETADNASKVATNYIDFDETNGLVIGDKREGATLTANTQINSEGVHIRDGETCLAHFTEDEITLGATKDTVAVFSNDGQTIKKGDKTLFMLKNKEIHSHSGKTEDGAMMACDNLFLLGNRIYSVSDDDSSVMWIGPWKTTSEGQPYFFSAMSYLMFTDTEGVADVELNASSYIEYPTTGIVNTKLDVHHERDNLENCYIKLNAPHIYANGKEVSVEGHTHTKSEISDFAHNHAGDALTPATINTTSTIKQNGTQVSLQGHTHEVSDINSTGTLYGATLLYNQLSGTTGTVTLSSAVNNFQIIEIYYFYGSNWGFTSLYGPNGKSLQLQQTYWSSGTTTTQTLFETITLKDATISRGTTGLIQTSGSTVKTSVPSGRFKIARVLGYI